MIYRIGFLLLFSINLFAEENMIKLPAPKLESAVSLESAMNQRRSVREFSEEILSLEHLSQLLWAGQGITGEDGFRTAPSAGALYPIELHILVNHVQGLDAGLYHYKPESHTLEPEQYPSGNLSRGRTTYRQDWIEEAAIIIYITAVPSRTRVKYGERTERYIFLEAGHIGQNLLLQATALGLGGTPVGAFDDDQVAKLLGTKQKPLYIIPIGHPWQP